MKKVLKINDIKNDYTNERGSLIIYLNKYSKESWLNRGENINFYDDANMGLNIFFENDGGEIQYVKSLILTKKEINLMFQNRINVVEDLGYFLAWGSNNMKIYDFGSYDTHSDKINDNHSRIVECGVHSFSVDNSEEQRSYDTFNIALKIVCNYHNNDLVNYTSSLCNYQLNPSELTIKELKIHE